MTRTDSALSTILQASREQHWRVPALEENTQQEEVCLRLSTLSLLPPEVTEEMERRFPKRLGRLDETGRLAITTAILEGRVTNERLQELIDKNPQDISFLSKWLVEECFLVGNDKRRWSSYAPVPTGDAPSSTSPQHKEAHNKQSEEEICKQSYLSCPSQACMFQRLCRK